MSRQYSNQRLNWKQIKGIRARLAAGESNRAIAQAFGLHEAYISRIKHGGVWKKLPTGRKPGSGASFIRVDTRPGKTRGLFIGRKLWQQVGEPEYVQLQALAPPDLRVRIVPAAEGYKIIRTAQAMPRIAPGLEVLKRLGLRDGRYPGYLDSRGDLYIIPTPETEAEEWLSSTQVVAVLHISHERLRQLIEQQRLQAYKAHGEYQVLKRDVLAYDEARKHPIRRKPRPRDTYTHQPRPQRHCLYCGRLLELKWPNTRKQFCDQACVAKHRWQQH